MESSNIGVPVRPARGTVPDTQGGIVPKNGSVVQIECLLSIATDQERGREHKPGGGHVAGHYPQKADGMPHRSL